MNYATGLALLAIFFWSTLAISAEKLSGVPIFFQLGVAFAIPGLGSFFFLRRLSIRNWLEIVFCSAGLIGYHLSLFAALRLAPAATANLINYLWPLFLVLMTPLFFPTKKLSFKVLWAASLCLLGVFLLVGSAPLSKDFLQGYVLAFLAAFLWPIYSLMKSRFSQLPESTSLVWSCLIASTFFFIASSLSEPFPQNLSQQELILLIWMSLFPFGAAFYLWGMALKKGDSRNIGLLSYLTPLLSTAWLFLFSDQSFQRPQLLGLTLILGGLLFGSGILARLRSGKASNS